jgi:peptidoglycan/LPS O-acetylase OafA/YrhL
MCVALIGITGRLRSSHKRKIILAGGLFATSAALVYFDARGIAQLNGKLAMVYELARLTMCFLLGGLYRELEGKLPLKLFAVFGLVLLAFVATRTSFFVPIANIATAYAALWLAFVPDGKWIEWTRAAPDYSYGIYIYAFPIQQALIASLPSASILSLFLLAFGITLVAAALSWHLVEKPALGYKHLGLPPEKWSSLN